jgi:hypothetical protein
MNMKKQNDMNVFSVLNELKEKENKTLTLVFLLCHMVYICKILYTYVFNLVLNLFYKFCFGPLVQLILIHTFCF